MCINDKVNEIKSEEMPKLTNKNLFINMLLRIYELFIKLLNIRTVIFGVGTWALANSYIDPWIWLCLSLLFMGEKWMRLGADLIEKIKN